VNRIPDDKPALKATCGKCHARLFQGKPVDLDAGAFEIHAGRNDIPVVVDFWAPWCGPCRAMAPVFDRAASELEPQARFARVNVDDEPALASRFGVQGIPALFLFRNGKVAAQHAGLIDYTALKRWIETH
jgi:thioredoxin 2